MSISLKSLYDQVQNISTSGVKSVSKADKGYIEFQNGLIINWGTNDRTFAKPYPNKCFTVVVCPNKRGYDCYAEHWSVLSISNTNFSCQGQGQTYSRWMAIGY